MYTLLKPIQVRSELLRRGVRIFTPETFQKIFQTKPYTTKYFLETQVKDSLFTRLKQGIYTLKTDPPTEEEVANALYQPSYISFEYALAYYSILPEMVYTVTSATTKPTRLFTSATTSYSYRTIKSAAYTGYRLVKKEEHSFFISEPEKAFVDYLYFVSLKRVTGSDRLVIRLAEKGYYNTEALSKEKISYYSKLFHHTQLDKLVSEFL